MTAYGEDKKIVQGDCSRMEKSRSTVPAREELTSTKYLFIRVFNRIAKDTITVLRFASIQTCVTGD